MISPFIFHFIVTERERDAIYQKKEPEIEHIWFFYNEIDWF